MYTYSPRNAHFGSRKRPCYVETVLVETKVIIEKSRGEVFLMGQDTIENVS